MTAFKDVGSNSNLAGRLDASRALFSLRKREHFLKIEGTLLCSLQNIRGHVPPVLPRFLRGSNGSYVYDSISLFNSDMGEIGVFSIFKEFAGFG